MHGYAIITYYQSLFSYRTTTQVCAPGYVEITTMRLFNGDTMIGNEGFQPACLAPARQLER